MHNRPHTPEARAKMSAARRGRPQYAKRRPMKIVCGVELWRCCTCGLFLPRESFYRDGRTLLGIKTQCKACHSKTSITSRNVERKRARGRIHEAARRARAAQSGGAVTGEDLARLTAILGHLCLRCGGDRQMQWDHIVPLAKGGAHHPRNLQPLCRRCNETKQARTADHRAPAQRAAVEGVWAISFEVIR